MFLAQTAVTTPPIAANFIQVQNTSGPATTTFPPIGTGVPAGALTSVMNMSGNGAANMVALGAGSVGAALMGLAAIFL